MDEREQLEQAIAALEAQRATLGDAVVDVALGPMREKLAAMRSPPGVAGAGGLRGERKPVTAVLVDVKGSTDLAEQLEMEVWVEMMNDLFKLLGKEIYRFGGEINQYRGDGLLAFFGAAEVHEDDPERAVLAAMAMLDAVKPYADAVAARDGVDLRLRVGVNTGEVVVTEVGEAQQHSEGTAMGRAIALAARMESSAEPGTVLVSENTYRLVPTQFEWQALGRIQVKGIHQPVTVYRPLAHYPSAKRRGFSGVEVPMVGRQREFAALQEAVQRLGTGHGGVVTIVGEAGLGKSRLVAELRRYVEGGRPKTSPNAKEMQWVEGHCASYSMSSAFWLWAEILRNVLGVTMETSTVQVRETLRDYVQGLCPNNGAETLFAHLARLMSLPLEDDDKDPLQGTGREGLKQGVFQAVERWVALTAQACPLILVCEDLHWADPTSLELLTHLLPLADHVPVLFICVSRPVDVGRIVCNPRLPPNNCFDIALTPLSVNDSESLLYALLQGLKALAAEAPRPTAAQVFTRVLEQAEGNPFYLEELVRTLMEEGVIRHEPGTGGWQVTRDVAEIAMPDTLHGVLMARIDHLPAETKRVLQLASVIGRAFQPRVLAELGSVSDLGLDEHLYVLQAMDLIREGTRGPETAPSPGDRDFAYRFKHHLTQQAAYNSLLHKERRVFHRQVAETLKRLFPDRMWENADLLAHHWQQAGESKHAIPHLIRAGRRAMMHLAHVEARAHLQRARTLAQEAGLMLAEAEALEQLAEAGRYRGDYADAKAHIQEALSIYRTFSNRRREAKLLGDLGRFARLEGDYAEAEARYTQMLELARLTRSWADEAKALSNLGTLCRNRGAYAEALAHFERSLRLSRAMKHEEGQRIGLSNVGTLYRILGKYDEAEACFAEAEQSLSRRFNHSGAQRWGQAILLNYKAALAHDRGDDEQAHT